MMRFKYAVPLLGLLSIVAGCGGGSVPGPKPTTSPTSSPTSSPSPGVTGSISIPAQNVTKYNVAQPSEIAAGADGNVWVLSNTTAAVYKFVPGSSSSTPYALGSDPGSDIAIGPDDNAYITQTNTHGVDYVSRVRADGAVTPYSIGLSPSSRVGAIAAGPDGRLWVAELMTGQMAGLTINGTFTEYTRPMGLRSMPLHMIAGPDGNLWFTEWGSGNPTNAIGTMPTTASTFTEFATGITPNSNPWAIVIGPDGNLWFTESAANKIGKITTSGTVTEYSVSPGYATRGITVGADRNLWFSESNGQQSGIGTITTGGVVREDLKTFASYHFESSGEMTLGSDGKIWVTSQTDNAVLAF